MTAMAKVFRPADRAGWYYQIDLAEPVGPFRTKRDASDACRTSGRRPLICPECGGSPIDENGPHEEFCPRYRPAEPDDPFNSDVAIAARSSNWPRRIR